MSLNGQPDSPRTVERLPPRAGILGRWDRLIRVVWQRPETQDAQKPQGIHALERPQLIHIFDAVRSEVKREDDLINQRNTWCILSTAALVAGIGALASKTTIIPLWLIGLLMMSFSLVGLRIAYLCAKAVLAARIQIEYVFKVYNDNSEAFLKAGLFRPFGSQASHESGIAYSLALPRIIFLFWVIIMTGSAIFVFLEAQK